MRLLIVRHAAAVDKDDFARTGSGDELRPLTPAGERDMRDISRSLNEMVPEIDALATSPLIRAVQTATLLGEVYDRKPVPVEWLRPEAPFEDFAKWAQSHRNKGVVVIVGHEPHLSELASWLLAGSSGRSLIVLKKAGACLLELEGRMAESSATLLWAMEPKQLRALARK